MSTGVSSITCLSARAVPQTATRATPTIDVRAPPTLSAAIVMAQYQHRHHSNGSGSSISNTSNAASAAAAQTRVASSTSSTSGGNGDSAAQMSVSDLEKFTSPCSSDGGVTTTTTATAGTAVSASAQGKSQPAAPRLPPPRIASRPLLSSPALAATTGATTTVTDVTAAGAVGRKPILSGRARQLRLQASTLSANGNNNDSVVGMTDSARALTMTLHTPTAPATPSLAVSLTRGAGGGSSAGLLTANSSFASTPHGPLSRPPSSSTNSFRRHYHLSSIAGCNYGGSASRTSTGGATAPGAAAATSGNSGMGSQPQSPALSTASATSGASSSARPAVSARHTFQRPTLPVLDSPAPTADTTATSSNTDNSLQPLLRHEYRELQKELATGSDKAVNAVVTAPGGVRRLPSRSGSVGRSATTSSTTATGTSSAKARTTGSTPGAFPHRKKATCPLHSVAGRLAAEKQQEAERVRKLQQQHHDMQIISNGGRESVAPTMKSSATIAGSSSKLLQRTRSRRGSGLDSVCVSAITSRMASPVQEGLGEQGCAANTSFLGAPAAARANSFFRSPDAREVRGPLTSHSTEAWRGSDATTGPRTADADTSFDLTTRDGEEGKHSKVCGDNSNLCGTLRSRAGSAVHPHRSTLKGEIIVMELQSDGSSSSASSSARSSPAARNRSPSPPLASTTTRNRRTPMTRTRPGTAATAAPTPAGGKHKINYHGTNDDDSDSEDECVFSFHSRRQNTVRRTPMAAPSLSLTAKPLPETVTSPLHNLTLKEAAVAEESLAGSLVLGGSDPVAVVPRKPETNAADIDVVHSRNATPHGQAAVEDECCYCCPCRRPENFFLLLRQSTEAKTVGVAAATEIAALSSHIPPAALDSARLDAEPDAGVATVASSVEGLPLYDQQELGAAASCNGDKDDSDDGIGPLLAVASFRRSSVRQMAS